MLKYSYSKKPPLPCKTPGYVLGLGNESIIDQKMRCFNPKQSNQIRALYTHLSWVCVFVSVLFYILAFTFTMFFRYTAEYNSFLTLLLCVFVSAKEIVRIALFSFYQKLFEDFRRTCSSVKKELKIDSIYSNQKHVNANIPDNFFLPKFEQIKILQSEIKTCMNKKALFERPQN